MKSPLKKKRKAFAVKKDTFSVLLSKKSKHWFLHWTYEVPTVKFAELVAYLEPFRKKPKDNPIFTVTKKK